MRKLLVFAICLSFIFFLNVMVWASNVLDPFPRAAKAYVLTMEGRPLWAHEPERELPPASLTKVMTARLVLKDTAIEDIVTIGADAAAETGSRIGLKEGQRFYVKDLLAAMLINSANDACRALADHVAGDEGKFVEMMNREAAALGLRRTHFTNACGHDNPEHYTTATELAHMAGETLKNPVFAYLVSVERRTINDVDGKRRIHLRNRNKLIGSYPGASGVKTGFTRAAGKCLITIAERDGVRVMLVLLNSPNRWMRAPLMLDKAFSQRLKLANVKGATRF